MQNAARQAPFGPFPKDDPKDEVARQTTGVVDMRGGAEWRSVFTVDTGAFQWGQLAISCEAAASPSVAHATDLPAWPWVEVRIEHTINGESYIYLEAAIGSHSNPATGGADTSAGPIVLAYWPGEVPDKIEVKARARRGGGAELTGDTDERLALVASSRFHR